MIIIDGTPYEWERFPNNEIKFPVVGTGAEKQITWLWENNEEFFVIQMITKHLKDNDGKVKLVVPFCPYGQQDRKMPDQLFSWKYFAQLVNDAGFYSVVIVDPHSRVMAASLNHCFVTYPELDMNTMFRIGYDLVFYPDNGAAKKYSEIYTDVPYRFGNKKRDLKTGEILGYEVIADKKDIEGQKILIVDDICMGGRTFKEAAKALLEMGAECVGLQITHFMPQAEEFLKHFREYGISEVYTYGDGVSRLIYTKLTKDECKFISLTSRLMGV